MASQGASASAPWRSSARASSGRLSRQASQSFFFAGSLRSTDSRALDPPWVRHQVRADLPKRSWRPRSAPFLKSAIAAAACFAGAAAGAPCLAAQRSSKPTQRMSAVDPLAQVASTSTPSAASRAATHAPLPAAAAATSGGQPPTFAAGSAPRRSSPRTAAASPTAQARSSAAGVGAAQPKTSATASCPPSRARRAAVRPVASVRRCPSAPRARSAKTTSRSPTDAATIRAVAPSDGRALSTSWHSNSTRSSAPFDAPSMDSRPKHFAMASRSRETMAADRGVASRPEPRPSGSAPAANTKPSFEPSPRVAAATASSVSTARRTPWSKASGAIRPSRGAADVRVFRAKSDAAWTFANA